MYIQKIDVEDGVCLVMGDKLLIFSSIVRRFEFNGLFILFLYIYINNNLYSSSRFLGLLRVSVVILIYCMINLLFLKIRKNLKRT